MAINKMILTEDIVQQLFELAGTPFKFRIFQERWSKFGWHYKEKSSDEFGFYVNISENWSLCVDPLGDTIISVSLPFLYWEDYEPQFAKDQNEYQRGRSTYKAEFEAAASLAQRVLPPVMARWHDSDKNGHNAIVWEGGHGLLILQQASFDTQFGIELNFWLIGCSKTEFTPISPLIDWLCHYNKNLHDQQGFPPLK